MCDPRLDPILAPVLPLLDRSIEQVEGCDWGPPTYHSSTVIGVHALRKMPLRELSIEQIRLSLSQQVGLPYTVPLALRLLCHDVLTEGRNYPGDLFAMMLSIPADYWSGYSSDVTLIHDLWTRFAQEADPDILAWTQRHWEQFTGQRSPSKWLRPSKPLHAPTGTTSPPRGHTE